MSSQQEFGTGLVPVIGLVWIDPETLAQRGPDTLDADTRESLIALLDDYDAVLADLKGTSIKRDHAEEDADDARFELEQLEESLVKNPQREQCACGKFFDEHHPVLDHWPAQQ